MSVIYVNDPANGESVSLSELGRRYGISAGCLSRRYHRGDRGQALIGQVSREELAKAKAAEYREKLDRQQRLIEANTAALMRPFKHIASVSKMVGGVHREQYSHHIKGLSRAGGIRGNLLHRI